MKKLFFAALAIAMILGIQGSIIFRYHWAWALTPLAVPVFILMVVGSIIIWIMASD